MDSVFITSLLAGFLGTLAILVPYTFISEYNEYQEKLKQKQEQKQEQEQDHSQDFESFEPTNSFLNHLEWANEVHTISNGTIDYQPILDAIRVAPSCFGIQPYKVFVITNNSLRQTLRPFCFDHPHITDSSVLLVFCAIKNVMERVDEYIVASDSEEKRVRAGGFISHVDNKLEWAGKQAYLALGFAVAAATELKIATVVTEEFFPNNISDMLSLDSNYVPCVMLALGSSDGSEPSFKFPSSNLFEVLE